LISERPNEHNTLYTADRPGSNLIRSLSWVWDSRTREN